MLAAAAAAVEVAAAERNSVQGDCDERKEVEEEAQEGAEGEEVKSDASVVAFHPQLKKEVDLGLVLGLLRKSLILRSQSWLGWPAACGTAH